MNEPTPNSNEVIPGRPLRVLIAEDHRINQALMVNLLRKQGHVVTLAGNGREAIEAFQRQHFDAILMDVQMPEMDGLEATGRIRELEKAQTPANGAAGSSPHIPIIALTAHALAGDRERCLRAGMDAYLAKPVGQGRLLQLLAELTGPLNAAEQPAGSEQSPAPAKKNGAEPMLDLELALIQVGADRQLLAELAGLFLSELEPWRAQLQQASGRGDLACVARLAHTIKGAAGTLAAPAVRGAALTLEQAAKVGDQAGSAAALRELERHLVQLEPTLRALG